MVGKLAVVFPGQGSQYVGMGKEIAQAHPAAMELFDRANEVLGRDLKQVIFDGPEEALKDTANTQPALYVTSLAIWEALKPWNLKPLLVAGHSLGEYSALAAAGAFSFEDGLKLVAARAGAMAAQSVKVDGTMAAVLGLADGQVREVCALSTTEGSSVEAANFNCPGQVVISGEKLAVERAMKLALEKGASKCVPLAVSGPFHSLYMRPAGDVLASSLSLAAWSQANPPLVANVSSSKVNGPTDIQKGLVSQLSSSVLWTSSVETMVKEGVDTFLEVGPGRVLSGLVRKISKDSKLANVEDLKSMAKAKETLERNPDAQP